MSDLTPNEIADYPLRTAVRGYRVEQVDELLDRVADRIEALERDLAAARDQVQAAERRAEEAVATESMLKRTLVTAQRAAEETVAEATAEAAQIRSTAEAEADQLLATARAEAEELRASAVEERRRAEEDAARTRDRAEQDVARLKDVASTFRSALQEHLDAHTRLLEDSPAAPADSPHGDVGPPRGPDTDVYGAPGEPPQDSALFASNGPMSTPSDPGGDFSG